MASVPPATGPGSTPVIGSDQSAPLIGAVTEPFPLLVALAADELTDTAVRLAEILAAQRGAVPTMLYVMEIPAIATADGGSGAAILTQALLDPAERARDEASLRAACRVDTGVPATWPFVVEIGDAPSSITTLARQMSAQLILMGLHHHGAVGRALGNDTLREVMALGGTPVLAATLELTDLPKSIVVATDFSQASLRAARLAYRLIADGGTMYLVFVASTLADTANESMEGQRLIEANGIAVAFTQLQRTLDPESRVNIVTVQRRGDPVKELKAVCEETHPDLVALGSQRHPFLDRLLLGSVARAIAGEARWPVLVTPPAEVRL